MPNDAVWVRTRVAEIGDGIIPDDRPRSGNIGATISAGVAEMS
jgi:hypothetical protein